MKDENWDDLRLFLHVAREGGLAGAADKTGISPPTIGRRMLALERSTGRALFIRAKTGYELAPDGLVLFDRVQGMQAAARSIADWREEVLSLPIVRIISDSAMSQFIGAQLPAIWRPDDAFRMCFKTRDGGIDLTYREADIALSAAPPQAGNVAARKSVEVAYAPYHAVGFDPGRFRNWVSLGTDVAVQAWERWVFEQPDRWITSWVNTPRMLFDVVAGGAGLGMLPCFIADRDKRLMRAGPIAAELGHPLWIVLHDDERHRGEVRQVVDRLVTLLQDHAGLFSGATGRDPS